ncbi:hypothetical protein [Nocardia pseudobrasiliensis]|uniref:Uncharacterized protein n=1 Tax=Nocardia pseudobrasiliensis TaxID=45979 RepID=A0A370HXJ0_9NOCA|nr:hypothetical protein [Nocardia pseudobrasiliensis]RDI63223.1 hypothetical protein DFR76_111242 [Nocardia pseudobrasiliensis]
MIYSATLPAQPAGGADVVAVAGVYSPAFYSGDTVTDVEIVAPAGFSPITGAANDNVTIEVRQLRDGVVLQTFAALTTAPGITLSAERPISLPISGQPLLLARDVIDVRLRQNGAGRAVGPGLYLSVFVS